MYSSISAVIPVYNSSKSIGELCSRLASTLPAIAWDYEIILVDDGSKDDSFDKMKVARQGNSKVKLIRFEKNFGQQNAIMCGLRYSKGDYVVTLDDDLQNPPEEVSLLMNEIKTGYDVVYGIPIERQHSFTRNFGSLMADLLFEVVCGKPIKIRVSSFRVIRRSIADKIVQDNTGFVYISAITLRYTKNIGNIIVTHNQRKYGSSNYNMKKLARLFFNIYINYSRIGSRMAKSDEPQYIIKEMCL